MPSGILCGSGMPNGVGGPAMTSVSGGSLPARTYYVVRTYSNNIGETLAGPEISQPIAANYLLKVLSPSVWTNATDYNVYVSETSGAEELQSVTAIGSDWTEPSSGLISGVSPPTTTPAIDLDSVFLGYVSPHTQAAATSIFIGDPAIDLNQRYEKLSYGSASSPTGILTGGAGGADLNTFFCASNGGSGSWSASLPSFPEPFTKSPQPYPTGTNTMSVTQVNGPGGTYTYTWSWAIKPSGDFGSFNIVSGQGTDTINWYAIGYNGDWVTLNITCEISSSASATTVAAATSMKFKIGTPS